MLEFEFRERAQDDIYNIIEYGTAEHGEAAARIYVEKIAARIQWLVSNPRLGSVQSELRGGIRAFRQGQHRIYYVVDTAKLTVIRILHVSMDVRLQLE